MFLKNYILFTWVLNIKALTLTLSVPFEDPARSFCH